MFNPLQKAGRKSSGTNRAGYIILHLLIAISLCAFLIFDFEFFFCFGSITRLHIQNVFCHKYISTISEALTQRENESFIIILQLTL